MKTIKKAQKGAKAKKKVDDNTTLHKTIFDNRYNEIYQQARRDSVAESNKTIGKTYLDLKKSKGKSPSAAELRAEQDRRNKEKISSSTPGYKISRLNAKQRADDKFEQEMTDRTIREKVGKNGKSIKKAKNGTSLGMKSVKAGFDKNPGVTRADIIVAGKKEAKSGAKLKKQAATAIAMKKAGKSPKKAMMGAMAKPMMKSGGKMKKCRYGCK